MANYNYKALDQRGVSATGEIEGESKAAAAAALRSRGLTVLDLNEAKKGLNMELDFLTRIKPKDLTVFSRQFATMVNSGLSMLRCLYVLEEQTAQALDDVVDQFRINWVWMPPWGPERITDDGRDMMRALGFAI